MLRIAAADALVDAFSADCVAHDASFVGGGILSACDAAVASFNKCLKSASGGGLHMRLDQEALSHARGVLSNLSRFVEYKRSR